MHATITVIAATVKGHPMRLTNHISSLRKLGLTCSNDGRLGGLNKNQLE